MHHTNNTSLISFWESVFLNIYVGISPSSGSTGIHALDICPESVNPVWIFYSPCTTLWVRSHWAIANAECKRDMETANFWMQSLPIFSLLQRSCSMWMSPKGLFTWNESLGKCPKRSKKNDKYQSFSLSLATFSRCEWVFMASSFLSVFVNYTTKSIEPIYSRNNRCK